MEGDRKSIEERKEGNEAVAEGERWKSVKEGEGMNSERRKVRWMMVGRDRKKRERR